MFKRKIAILFLLIAQVVLLGHAVVAHHHHLLTATEDHHHDQDHEQDESEKGFLDIVFSGFIHSGEQVTYTHSDNTEVSFVKQASNPCAVLISSSPVPFQYSITFIKQVFSPERLITYNSLYPNPHSLRGPPSFIVV